MASDTEQAKEDSFCRLESLSEPLVGPSDPTWGQDTAPVTLVLFDEFDHVYGRRMNRTLAKLVERYGPEHLRIVWKNNPMSFHEQARSAAIVGQAVFVQKGSKAFWSYHDALFGRGGVAEDYVEALTPGDIQAAAASVGVDETAVRKALEDPALSAKIDGDASLVKALGINGAPTTLINGKQLGGAQPLERFVELIDTELAATKGAARPGKLACERTQVATAAARQAAAAKPPQPPRPPPDTKTVWKMPLGKSPRRGSDKALVTIVEFGGYQDPFSRRAEKVLEKLRSEYGEKLRIVWKDNPLPFQLKSEPGAELAREALSKKGLDGFWAVHDKLLAGDIDHDSLEATAVAVGLDWKSAKDAIEKKKYERDIEADQILADEFAAPGTPHFFINGRRFVGAQPIEAFRKIIDEEIVHANELIAKGTKPGAVYEAIIANGKPPEPPEKLGVDAPGPGSPSRGSAKAKVVIQEFGGFQDPFSARVEPTVKDLLRLYDGKIRIVWRNRPLPFHPEAQLCGEAAAEAQAQKGVDGFWRMHDLLLSKQSEPGGLKQPALERYAAELGLDVARFRAALEDHRHAPAVAADLSLAERVGITGTPTFVINGYRVSGAQPIRHFKRVIDKALSENR